MTLAIAGEVHAADQEARLANGQTEHYDRPLLLHMFILEILNSPIKWAKPRRRPAGLEWLLGGHGAI